MRPVVPWIVAQSLPDALAQIAALRIRIGEASTYDGVPLTANMRATFMAMLDEIEREEVSNARQLEEERLKRARQTFESALKQRAAALTEIATASDWLADGISKILKSDAAAVEAAREAGMDVPSINGELRKLTQAIADALKPLSAIAESG
jgi:hypothetical protein